jgi:hypothetical protein
MNAIARATHLRQRIARRALATIRTPKDAHILDVVRVGTVVIVATYQERDRYPYCVDSFRLLTPAEKDPEDWAPYQPKDFTLIDQYCGSGDDELPRLLAQAIAYASQP